MILVGSVLCCLMLHSGIAISLYHRLYRNEDTIQKSCLISRSKTLSVAARI